MSRLLQVLVLLSAVGLAISAEVAPAPAVKPAVSAKPEAVAGLGKLAEEEKWTFEPAPGRPDVFVDLEAKMAAEAKLANLLEKGKESTVVTQPGQQGPTPEQALEWARGEIQRIEGMIVARRWDEAIKTCDNAIKALQKHQDNEPIRKEVERLKSFRTQAEEAKIYEEAQAKFDALNLRIEGVLWQPAGVQVVDGKSRELTALAVISGEPRALGVNARVKDCVILNIDTNRVDFLFHYQRRRFEFQRYVGEDANTTGAAKAKTK